MIHSFNSQLSVQADIQSNSYVVEHLAPSQKEHNDEVAPIEEENPREEIEPPVDQLQLEIAARY